MKKLIYFLVLAMISCSLYAQPTFPVNGVHDDRDGLYALTNATIFTKYNQKVENATLIIRDGKVEMVGAKIPIPNGAVVLDMKGKFIYPSFIDIYADYGMPEQPKSKHDWRAPEQFVSKKDGAYGWNEAIKSEINAAEIFKVTDKDAKDWRNVGFGTVLTHQHDGIARGSGAAVLLCEKTENEVILKDKASAHYSFSKGTSKQGYPSSLMGSIALLRQTYLDADWYKKVQLEEEYNITLDTWLKLQGLPQIFESGDKLSSLRADKVGDEFGVQYILKGSGNEYQRIDELKATGAKFIIPLEFPDAYDVEDPYAALNVSLQDMKHWELAPSNAAMLQKAGIVFALTPHGLKDKKDFLKNLRKAIKRGLSEEAALKALTMTPASMMGVANQVGSLEAGKVANFIIASDSLFKKDSEIQENWVAGIRHTVKAWKQTELRGEYALKIDGETYTMMVLGKEAMKASAKIVINDSTNIKVKHKFAEQTITLSFTTQDNTKEKLGEGLVRLGGSISADGKNWSGTGQNAKGDWITWSATRSQEYSEEMEKVHKAKGKKGDKKDEKEKENEDENDDEQDDSQADSGSSDDKKEDKKKEEEEEKIGNLTYPFQVYGWTEKPKQETVLFKNATVWTNEADGILEKTDVLVQSGKIAKIGKNLTAPSGAKTIDASGQHLTCGIIDEHSHIAISRGVNEGTQAISAEVRIGDVVNSEDVNLYRQLAGGVTTAQLLHGSANPVGGQSALIKFRWGSAPEAMKFEGADGFIKFALGENVKQSNWGDSRTSRFPQTRMGVEQVFDDGFTRAREYGKSLAAARQKGAKPVRRDLELETLLEIMNKKRFITCHSYVQSEINMLMKVAERYDFRVNTFTHILEGYKVADKMAEHGVAGSTFSDWWAYKYEVIDAIPYNGAILQQMGVLTSFNSDDAEMGRRLNQEAAKAVKYGGLSEEEAWKFVTLNPAKMLHIDNRVGSIKVGKDADVVLWSDNPLSIYAKAQKTYVDGICYFDSERDLALRTEIQTERNRLIQKMAKAKANGGKTQKPSMKRQKLYHCDDLGDEEFEYGHEEEHEHHH